MGKTEDTLTKLQSSVEYEEKKWKDLLDEKEEDCRQLKELSANLRAELETSKQSNTEITVDNQELSQSDWLQGFELEAQKYMEIMTSNSIDAGIQERLEESEKEKEKLDSQVQNFKEILTKTEDTLTKLQSSVEYEEKKW